MQVYSVNGDIKYLLLVDNRFVINGHYHLIEHEGQLVTDRTYIPVKYEGETEFIERNYNKTLYEFEKRKGWVG